MFWVLGINVGGFLFLLILVNVIEYYVFVIEVFGVMDVGFDIFVIVVNLVMDYFIINYWEIGCFVIDGFVNIFVIFNCN